MDKSSIAFFTRMPVLPSARGNDTHPQVCTREGLLPQASLPHLCYTFFSIGGTSCSSATCYVPPDGFSQPSWWTITAANMLKRSTETLTNRH